MSEKIPTPANSVEAPANYYERKEAGPIEAEQFLSAEHLPCHEESISESNNELELHSIITAVTAEESRVNAVIEREDATEAELRAVQDERYKLRHLGYLREVAKRRLAQLDLRVAA